MAPAGRRGWWLFFLLVTGLVSLPLLLAYLYLGRDLVRLERETLEARIAGQLSLWQEQLYDAKWDNLADTHDDTLHLGSADEAQLLRDTLRWYVYPDGRCFVEGIAIIDPDGSLRPSRQAALIDDQGRPLEPHRLAALKSGLPWLAEPWLPGYAFVMEAFVRDPDLAYYTSPFIQAPGRLVYVVASVLRDPAGRPLAAVMIQNAVDKVCQNLILPGTRDHQTWLMDRRGNLGWSSGPLARLSALALANGPDLRRLLEQGREAVSQGDYGAGLRLGQELDGLACQVFLRSVDDQFVIGIVHSEAGLGLRGRKLLQDFGAIALLSLVMLALAGAVYTVSALRQQAGSVARDTLARLAGTISHRGRNHLAALRGNLEMVLARDLDHPQQARRRLEGPVEQALQGIEDDLAALERLARGDLPPDLDGQAGSDTMFRLDGGGRRGEGKR